MLVDEPLGVRTTYRVGGNAAIFVDASDVGDVAHTARVADNYGLPMIVVGRGSNMLVADHGFAGVALSVAHVAADVDIDLDRSVAVAGGGVELPKAARRTAAAGLSGFEWAVGVPGSIGGAVRMNAGGHGSDMAEVLTSVDVIDIEHSSDVVTLPASALGLRFRASALAPGAVVLKATLQLRPGDPATSKREIADIVRWRREHQPGGQNCGSVFVNPVPGEVTAGGLIDDAGLRGFRIGTSWVSEKHANFIQADDGGSAADVRAVIEAVRARVEADSGFRLRSEVRLVGFSDADPLSFGDHDHTGDHDGAGDHDTLRERAGRPDATADAGEPLSHPSVDDRIHGARLARKPGR